MPRLLLAALFLLGLLVGVPDAADNKDKKDQAFPRPASVVIAKVDAQKGEITVKYADAQGKEQEKTFHLAKDVRFLDETGRVVALDVFQAGNEALILESEGKLHELRRYVRPHQGRRLSDAVNTLIEMTDSGPVYTEELQRIYDTLRKLDTAKNGKIDPAALKAARDRMVEERIDDLIKRLDTNKDGKISREEAKGMVKEHFDKLDTNKDGFVDREELLKAAREKYESKSSTTEKK